MYSQLHVEKIGSVGPAIVMLHGWGQSLEALKPLAALLSSSSQVYLVDLPGFGKSLPPQDVWDSFQYAETIVHTLGSLGVSRFAVLGHSFGGKVAMSMAVKYPEAIEKLILLAPSGLKRRRSLLGWLRFMAVKGLGRGVKGLDALFGKNWFETFFVARFGSADYKQADAMRAILVKTVNEDFSPWLSQIQMPTLLLWGQNDLQTPVEMAERFARQIHGSKLCLFAHKDHYLFQDCGSHLCAYHIQAFMRGQHG